MEFTGVPKHFCPRQPCSNMVPTRVLGALRNLIILAGQKNKVRNVTGLNK